MKLLINPEGGMAGDMFSAALISAGADFNAVRSAMLAAAEKLGSAQIELKETADGSSQLAIVLNSQRHHLGGDEAREILEELCHRFAVGEKYRVFGLKILEILVKAEKIAHARYHIVMEDDIHPSHQHSHHPDGKSHHHETTFLHEAQDIVIDIIGAVTGMQQLGLEPEAELVMPVSVGGGQVRFSHGVHSIPAPATTVILQEYHLEWKRGPVEVELFTPTGAAILAALGARFNSTLDIESLSVAARGKARGSKILDIPPVELLLYNETYN
jgi:pyridinium-3,5-bisthiocarboxylic acid mononucleotide nickel chelatase